MSSILSDAPKYAYPDQYKDANYVWFKNNTQQIVAVTISRDQGLYGDDSPHPLQAGETASWGRTKDATFNYTISAMQNGFPVQPPIMTGTCARGIVYTYNGPNNVTAPAHPSTSAYSNEGMRLLDQWSDDPSNLGIYASTAESDLAFKNWLINGGWKNTSTSSGSTSAVPIVEGQDYYIFSKLNNKVLGVPGASQTQAQCIIMWDKEPVAHEQFRFQSDGGGYYYIIAKHSGQAVHAQGTENDAIISQYPKDGLDNGTLDRFRWKFEPAGENYFYLVLKAGGRVLTIDRALSDNGARLVLYAGHQELHQRWRFELVSGVAPSPSAAGPEIIGVGMDNALWTRKTLTDNWSQVPGSGSVTRIAVMPDGKILGVGGDNQLWYRDSLNAPWQLVPGSGSVTGIAVEPSGRIIGIGMDQGLWTRNSLNDNWSQVPNSGSVIGIAVMPDGKILGVGGDNQLWYRDSLNAPWQLVPGSGSVTGIAVEPNGRIIGIGMDQGLWTRNSLNDNWSPVSNSAAVMAVTYGGKVKL